MAAVSRRRRFTIIVIICCLSVLLFTWYSRPSDNFLKLTENLSITDELFGSPKTHSGFKHPQHLPPPEESQKESELMDFVEEEKTSLRHTEEDFASGPTEYDDMPVTRSYKRQPDDLELFSGPTDYDDIPITISMRRHPDLEMENSGPTEFEMPVTIPIKRHPDVEMENSGPTEFEMPVTVPVRRHPDIEMESSGPTEENMVESEELVTPSMHTNELESSAKHVNKKHQQPSVKGTTPSILQITLPDKDTSLILDTPGCKVPKLDPWDATVKNLIELREPYECPGPPLFMKASSDGSIILNETILEKYYDMKPHELKCHYQPIYRKHEDPGNVRENDFTTGNISQLHFGVPLHEDYVGTTCHLKNKSKPFEQFFPLVRLKKEIEDVRNSITPPKPRLNVILAGIDSISKLNYLRHFRKTEAFIKEKLNMFEMNGYTKVGDNTFPNLVPMLTGHFVEYYWNESLKDEMYFDDIGLIWKDYAKKGYRTFYAEDSPYTGTFNYIKRGFYDPPTDYYSRPLLLAVDNANLIEKTGKSHCYNSQFEPELLYDYLKNFIEAMEKRPYIAFAMVSTITHDYLNHAGWEDQPTVHLLEDLSNMGALNNSLFVLFSDHGLRFGQIRYTYIGKFEERMPFMYIHAPKWFLDQHPQYARNLEINQNRLMTLFDIHATMIHLLDLSKSPEERAKLSMGKSLLEEISPNRTCEQANILPHWCPCQTFENVPLNSTAALNASQTIVDDINSKLAEYGSICEILEIAEIMDARVGQANDLVLRFIRHDNVVVNRTVVLGDRIDPIADYMITLVTKPGHAVFEGTVRHDPENNSYSVLGISRISLYGKTSWCIESQKMKIFCYCKVQQAS